MARGSPSKRFCLARHSVVVSQKTAAKACSQRERSTIDWAAQANRRSASTRVCQAADAPIQTAARAQKQQEMCPIGDTEPPIAAAEPDACNGAAWAAPEPTAVLQQSDCVGGSDSCCSSCCPAGRRPWQQSYSTRAHRAFTPRHTCAAANRIFEKHCLGWSRRHHLCCSSDCVGGSDSCCSHCCPVDLSQAPAAVAAPADPARAPAHC